VRLGDDGVTGKVPLGAFDGLRVLAGEFGGLVTPSAEVFHVLQVGAGRGKEGGGHVEHAGQLREAGQVIVSPGQLAFNVVREVTATGVVAHDDFFILLLTDTLQKTGCACTRLRCVFPGRGCACTGAGCMRT
jgi:hypothetical protein